MDFKNKVKAYLSLSINEEMADKTSAELSQLVAQLKPIYKTGKVVNIQKYAAEVKSKADELRTNNAYKGLVAKADSLVKEMLAFIKQK